MHDMFHYMSPGTLGAHNGGTDFNDIVHPAARCFVEGLFGIRPDLPNGIVEIAPQLSPDWDNASISTPLVSIEATGFRQAATAFTGENSDGTTTLSATVHACANCTLRLVLPLRAAHLKGVSLNGKPCDDYNVTRGFGQSLVEITTKVAVSQPVVASLSYSAAHGHAPAVRVQRTVGSELDLDVTTSCGADLCSSWSWAVESVEDPQGFLKTWTHVGGIVSVVLANRTGFGVVAVNVRLGTSTNASSHSIQTRLFKLNISDPVAEAAHTAKVDVALDQASSATWTSVDISGQLNGNLSLIFHPAGGYLEPRPATCSARIGTDGWSAWTFTYGQGNSAPFPTFFENYTTSGGVTTPQGAQFQLRAKEPKNTAFVSQWHNHPTNVTVPLSSKVESGDVVWLLISGSTNNMQTRLANAVIHFSYTNGTIEHLELVPPLNYWALSPIGGVDYDYVRDGFCLPPTPPPTMQLGEANRAMVYSWRATTAMESVTLEALSLEVVLGLLAVSVSHNAPANGLPLQ
jgi:hypothetical protein